MRTLLIDGDMLAYRNAVVLEQRRVIDWGDGVTSTMGPAQAVIAQRRISSQISKWQEDYEADNCIVFISEADPSKDFRKKILPTYKLERKDKVRPELLMPLKLWLLEPERPWESYCILNLEADDGMGIWATNPEVKGEKIIVSIDKDLRQVPGLYLNPYKDEPKVQRITDIEADIWWMTQCLIGDTCDGYIGCRGIGPKHAKAILDEAMKDQTCYEGMPSVVSFLWPAVIKAFESKGFTEETAIQMARVSRVLRHGEYDFKTGEVKLWLP